jgi:putative ABC transport system permease protein
MPTRLYRKGLIVLHWDTAMRELLADFSSDLRNGLWQARKHLSLTIVSVAVLAIGIGSTAAVFAILYDAILKPLPYRDAAQLVYVHNEFPQSQLAETEESAPDFADLSTHHEIFSETAAYYFNDFTMTGAGAAQHVDAVNASATLFPMLGMRPELGRAFTPEEDRYGTAKVVMLSDEFWRSTFSADRNVIGHSISLDGTSCQIIGVMPADFNFPFPATQMWIPLALKPSEFAPDARGGKWLRMIARVAPGLTPQRANAVLAGISRRLAKLYPDDYPAKTGWHFSCVPMVEQETHAIRGWLLLAFGAVFCVLLIACINVSVLLLVRAGVRRGEWAVRAALGASPARLARQILAETGVLALIGCVAGILLAFVLVNLSNQFGPIHRTSIEPWTLLFCAGLCILATILAGILPAFSFSRLQLEQELRASSPRASGRESAWRRILIAGQIGIAIALLFTATALSRSFVKLLDVSPGFSPQNVWTGSVQLPRPRYNSGSQPSLHFFQEFVRRVSALPSVESASAVGELPFSSSGVSRVEFELSTQSKPAIRVSAGVNEVLPGYFETMKIPLLEGRTFTEDDLDVHKRHLVAIVNQAFARKYLSGADSPYRSFGTQSGFISYNGKSRIIGVVGDVRNHDLAEPHQPEMYFPGVYAGMFLVARTSRNVDITSSVRDALRSMDPTVALFDVETMPARILDSVKLRRFVAWLLNSFAFTGALLAMLGLYGTLAHLVELRRREIAIRMALGASPRSVRSLVARHSLYIALGGLIPGAIFSFVAIRATQSFLFGISPLDGWTVAATLLGFFALALLASWIPVMRATRINALLALREE